MLELIEHSAMIAVMVYVWLLSPLPDLIAEILTPRKTPLNTFTVMLSYCRLEIGKAMTCDKCQGMWWGLGFGFLYFGYTGVTLLAFACVNVVLVKLLNNHVGW